MVENRIVRFIHQIATGKPFMKWFMTLVAPLLLVTFGIIFILLAMKTDEVLGFTWPLPHRLSAVISVSVMACGLVLVSWCIARFVLARGTPVPFNPPQELVIRGPYRVCRNPMISGLLLIIGGLAVLLHSISLLLFYLPVLIVLNYFELRMIEEPELEKRFGKSYVEYKNMTPMFIPRLRRQK